MIDKYDDADEDSEVEANADDDVEEERSRLDTSYNKTALHTGSHHVEDTVPG